MVIIPDTISPLQLLTSVLDQVLESYERAYNNMVRVQQLLELEEV